MNQQSYFLTITRQLFSLASKTKFRIYSFFIFLFAIPLTYGVLEFAHANNLFEVINKFPPEMTELLSLNSWWVNIMIGMCIPVCLSFALSIQLARLSPHHADTIKNALPWIFPLKDILFSKISIFLVSTSAVFFGAVIFLTFGEVKNHYKNLGLSVFPSVIFYLALEIRKILSEDPMKGKIGQFLLNHHRFFTRIFIALALLLWAYCELWTPILTRWEIFVFFKSHNIT